jgi:hypothetical protein
MNIDRKRLFTNASVQFALNSCSIEIILIACEPCLEENLVLCLGCLKMRLTQ